MFAPPMRDFSSPITDVYARMTRKKMNILYYLITASNFLSFKVLFVQFPSKQNHATITMIFTLYPRLLLL